MNDTGADGLLSRIDNFDVTNLHPEVAAKAKEILQKYRVDDVREKSDAAATFYTWVSARIPITLAKSFEHPFCLQRCFKIDCVTLDPDPN